MIRTEAELKTADEFLNRDLDLYDYDLSRRMDSTQYNLYMQDTEFYLDMLYEKLRVLEDLIEYLEYYSSSKLAKLRDYIEQRSGMLEKMTNEYISRECTSVSALWELKPLYKLQDRDGSRLPVAEQTTGYDIIPGGIKTHVQKIDSVSRQSDLMPFSSNVDTCIKDNMYISFYSLDKPQEIEEILLIKIPAPKDFDHIDYETMNCNAVYMGIDDDGNVVIKLNTNIFFKEYENFDFGIYSGTNLNSLDYAKSCSKKRVSVYADQRNLAEVMDKKSGAEYLRSLSRYYKVNEDNKKKSERLTHGLNYQ